MVIRDAETQIGAHVTSDKMLHVYATVESEISHQSEVDGTAYSWTTSKDIDATDSIIWLRNDSTTENLIIQTISFNSTAAGTWFIYCPTGTTADGDTITGVNLNRQSGKVALATCRQDATGATPANYIYRGASMANEDKVINTYGALILGHLNEVALDVTTEPALAQATIIGYYHIVD